jgi:hypothetical protein
MLHVVHIQLSNRTDLHYFVWNAVTGITVMLPVTNKEILEMKKLMVELDWDHVEDLIRDQLRQSYIDTVTVWKAQPDSAKLAENLLGVIQYYSAPNEYEEWLETVKDL